jgi:CTP:phosphocholine cytidylyltransferase-like protein
MMATVKIMTMNCRGLADKKKRFDVLNYLKEKNCMINCLQDTHFDKNVRCALDKDWQGDYYCSYQNTQSRGVTILFNNHFDYNVHDVKIDPRGNFVVIDVSFHDKRFTLSSVYGPNKDTPDFYNNINKNY